MELLVCNLDTWVTQKQLEKKFLTFGRVVSVRVLPKSPDADTIDAFVKFRNASDGRRAIKALDGDFYDDLHSRSVLQIKQAPDRQRMRHVDNNMATLFLRNLDSHATKAMLTNIFSSYGKVLDCEIYIDYDTIGNSTRRGRVTFVNEEHAEQALSALNGTVLGGGTQAVLIQRFLTKEERANIEDARSAEGTPSYEPYSCDPATTIYVGNLDQERVSEALLAAYFERFGQVRSVNLKEGTKEQTNQATFAFVTFDKAQDAELALKMDNHALPNNSRLVSVRKFVDKEKRQRQNDERKEHEKSHIAYSLKVDNLASEVSSLLLREHFEEFGAVVSAVAVRDNERKSLGFGYVNFANKRDGEAARNATDRTHFKGKQLRVRETRNAFPGKTIPRNVEREWEPFPEEDVPEMPQKQIVQEKEPEEEAYVLKVENLAAEVTHTLLRKHFQRFGAITKVKVDSDKDRGFVHFANKKEGKAAMKATDMSKFKGEELRVRHWKKQEKPRKQIDKENESGEDAYMLKVENLAPEVTDALLKVHFEQFGVVTKATVARDKEQNSLGYGFVSFAEKTEGRAAKKAADKETFMGEELHVRKWKLEEELESQFDEEAAREKEKGAYVCKIENLSPDVTDLLLKEYFQQFGVVTKAKVFSVRKCKSSGFGFVVLPNKKEVTAAKKADKSIFMQKRIRILEWRKKIPERRINSGAGRNNAGASGGRIILKC